MAEAVSTRTCRLQLHVSARWLVIIYIRLLFCALWGRGLFRMWVQSSLLRIVSCVCSEASTPLLALECDLNSWRWSLRAWHAWTLAKFFYGFCIAVPIYMTLVVQYLSLSVCACVIACVAAHRASSNIWLLCLEGGYSGWPLQQWLFLDRWLECSHSAWEDIRYTSASY